MGRIVRDREEARRAYPNDEHLVELIGEEQILGSITMNSIGGGCLHAENREVVEILAATPANTLEGVAWKLCNIKEVVECIDGVGEVTKQQLRVAIEDLCAMIDREREGRDGGAS